MAISAVQYSIVRDLFERGLLPQGGAILELGAANWYGDADARQLAAEIDNRATDPDRRAALARRLDEALAMGSVAGAFEVAKIYYEIFFSPSNVQAIDFDNAAQAHRFDLNEPVQLDRRFQVVFNHGTAEHIFNIAQVFRTMHEYTVPGGMMIHEGPVTGWIDHGFYTLHPTLFFDVAEANQYPTLVMFVEDFATRTAIPIDSRARAGELFAANQLPENGVLFAALIKGPTDHAFEIPKWRHPSGARSESGLSS